MLMTRVFSKGEEWFFEVGSGRLKKCRGPFKTLRGAEYALTAYIRKHELELPNNDERMNAILETVGLTCCRMAFKLSYVSMIPVQEVGELLGISEETAEKAIQAGEYSLGYLKMGTAARLTKTEVEQAVGQMFF